MTLNRYDPKRDSNEPAIRATLHKLGIWTKALSDPGVPDLLCKYRARWFFVEVKTPAGRITPLQQTFIDNAGDAPVFVIDDPDHKSIKKKLAKVLE